MGTGTGERHAQASPRWGDWIGMSNRNEKETVGEAATWAARRLAEAGVESPRREAEILVREASGLSRERFFARPETPLSPHAQEVTGAIRGAAGEARTARVYPRTP